MLTQVIDTNPLVMYWRLSRPLKLVIATQLAFNIGFYLVVPFLAAHLDEDLHLAGWLIGLVLGLRTFSQQGMFFLGGALADRFGIRTSIVVGCMIRILGFVSLAISSHIFGIIVGVILVGLAAALFSPATESAIVAWGEEEQLNDGPPLQEIIGLEIMASKLGTVLGPVLGGVLLIIPFRTTCFVASIIFGLILLIHLVLLPKEASVCEPHTVNESFHHVTSNQSFLLFAIINSSYLLAYNQLYLALPVELKRINAPSASITWFFVLAAIFTIFLQLPLTRLTAHIKHSTMTTWGYGLLVAAFVSIAVSTLFTPLPGVAAYLPSIVFVLLLHLGQLFILPNARTIVAHLAGGQSLGTYLGFLASVGGFVVLIGSTAIGTILPKAAITSPSAAIPWLILAIPPLLSTLAVGPFFRKHIPESPQIGEK